MYKIRIISNFNAAHQLRNYRGKCERLHGHNWKVEVSVYSKNLNKNGMLMDFKVLKKKLNKVVDKLDHSYLNELDYFKRNEPTSENIAKYIFKKIKALIKNKDITLESVSVWETETSCAEYKQP